LLHRSIRKLLGPAGVLLHGFGATGDMWAPLAAALAPDPTVVVPDRRGMGLSSHPADGDDKRTQAADVRAVRTPLAASGRSSSGTVSAPWSPLPMPPALPTRPPPVVNERSWGRAKHLPGHPRHVLYAYFGFTARSTG
jgi:hypothetical protein